MGELVEVDGGRLYCEQRGAGPAVVLIHGFSLSARVWERQVPALAERFRVVAYDARGFGRSSPAARGSPSHAEDLEALLARLALERPALVGLSMGGMIACELAARRPDALRALVLADAFAGGHDWSEGFLDEWASFEELARTDPARARAAWLGSGLFAPARRDPALARELDAIVGGYSCWHWREGIRVGGKRNTLERLPALQAPALVVVGDLDVDDFQRGADELCERIPRARKAVIRDAGHLSNMERPDEFNRLVLEFLDSPEART